MPFQSLSLPRLRPARAPARLAMCLAVGGWLTACATPVPPQHLLAPADAAIDRARAVGAVREAPRELYAARVKRERAQFLADDGDLKAARRSAEEAVVDAELAWARTAARQAQGRVEGPGDASPPALQRNAP